MILVTGDVEFFFFFFFRKKQTSQRERGRGREKKNRWPSPCFFPFFLFAIEILIETNPHFHFSLLRRKSMESICTDDSKNRSKAATMASARPFFFVLDTGRRLLYRSMFFLFSRLYHPSSNQLSHKKRKRTGRGHCYNAGSKVLPGGWSSERRRKRGTGTGGESARKG